MGSPAVAAWIAYAAFCILTVYGVTVGELNRKRLAIFLGLLLAGRLLMPYLPYEPARGMFPSYVAALDIALVFTIFKGDVRLT